MGMYQGHIHDSSAAGTFLSNGVSGRRKSRWLLWLLLSVSLAPGLSQGVEPLAAPTQPTATPRKTTAAAQESNATGAITTSGQGYRGRFGWFGTDPQEIAAGDDTTSVQCYTPDAGLTIRLWDGYGQCIVNPDPDHPSNRPDNTDREETVP